MTRSPLFTEFEQLINRASRENASGTPDFILANYLLAALENYEATVNARDKWWGFEPRIGGTVPAADDFTERRQHAAERLYTRTPSEGALSPDGNPPPAEPLEGVAP